MIVNFKIFLFPYANHKGKVEYIFHFLVMSVIQNEIWKKLNVLFQWSGASLKRLVSLSYELHMSPTDRNQYR